MKFIRFGKGILNLERVSAIVSQGAELRAIFDGNYISVMCESEQACLDEVQRLTDIFCEKSSDYTKSEDKPKARVMTAGEATKLPDILGKRVKVFDFYTADQIDSRIDNDDPLRVSSGDDDFIWLDKTQMIEVLD